MCSVNKNDSITQCESILGRCAINPRARLTLHLLVSAVLYNNAVCDTETRSGVCLSTSLEEEEKEEEERRRKKITRDESTPPVGRR